MYYWIYALFYMFLTFILGQLFIEENLKLLFFLVMFLLYVSLNNIYFSTKYYMKLRNTPGIKGERGDPGRQGQDGSNGVCTIAKDCGIANCRMLIGEYLQDKFTEYKTIIKKIDTNQALDSGQKKIYSHMNSYIDMLVPQCESFETSSGNDKITEFKKIIDNTIKDDTG